jgi:hypothetical protein
MPSKDRIQCRLNFAPGHPLYDDLRILSGNASAIRAKLYTLIDLGLNQYRRLQQQDMATPQAVRVVSSPLPEQPLATKGGDSPPPGNESITSAPEKIDLGFIIQD